MSPAAPQTELFPRPAATPGTIFVNDRVCIQSEENQRVISVHGIVFSHYSSKDHSAEAYAMVQLFESGYADQNDIARCFSYSARTLRRYQERFKAGGLSALARPRGRPAACSPVYKKLPGRDRTILRLKTKEMSNRWIAGRLGLSEKAVRKSLRRLGWKPGPEPSLSFLPEARSQVQLAVASASTLLETPPSVTDQPAEKMPQLPTEAAAKSLDANPLDRSMDCLLAAMGLLDDALPVFAATRSLPRAGVLLAIPLLVASGLLSTAEKIYGSLGPAFYGLRTTLVAYVLLALLRIPRPETLQEYPPGELGRIVGLDRMPEVKTLRRKLAHLAALKGSYTSAHN
jgi:transposase